MLAAPAAPGRRVKVVPPAYRGTDVYYSLYLPENYPARQPHPVIVEYTGNYHPPSNCTGEVKDASLGYVPARALNALWVVMPYVSADKKAVSTWWGSPAQTVEFCLKNMAEILQQYNVDQAKVFICGFSRGAIGVNYLGLFNDEIAALWAGFFAHDHYDGHREWRGEAWGSPLAQYRTAAAARLQRLQGRPVLISQSAKNIAEIQNYLKTCDLAKHGRFTWAAHDMAKILPPDSGIPPHNDSWLTFPSVHREKVLKWFQRFA